MAGQQMPFQGFPYETDEYGKDQKFRLSLYVYATENWETDSTEELIDHMQQVYDWTMVKYNDPTDNQSGPSGGQYL